ncbi:MAG: ABC transporter permease [Deltaproteobacteria bacterium]|nr:ABC transporter permease [Deltaproteobacteria bacterium]
MIIASFFKKLDYPFLLSAFFYRILKTIFIKAGQGRRVIRKTIVKQIYFTAVEVLLLLGIIGVIFGALVIIQILAQLSRVGISEALGQFLVVIVIRELGPLIAAVIVILYTGTAMATEVGYMTVLGDIRAITMRGIDPIHFVAVPRLIGTTIAMVCLLIYFDVVALLGGFIVSWLLTGIPFYTFIMGVAASIGASDIIIGFIKAIFFAAIIVVICLYRGFQVGGEITRLPRAISKSAMDCFLGLLIVDLIISGIFYL